MADEAYGSAKESSSSVSSSDSSSSSGSSGYPSSSDSGDSGGSSSSSSASGSAGNPGDGSIIFQSEIGMMMAEEDGFAGLYMSNEEENFMHAPQTAATYTPLGASMPVSVPLVPVAPGHYTAGALTFLIASGAWTGALDGQPLLPPQAPPDPGGPPYGVWMDTVTGPILIA